MILPSELQMEALCNQFQKQRLVFIKNCVPQPQIQEWLAVSQSFPTRRVTTKGNNTDSNWDEHFVEEKNAFNQVLLASGLIGFALKLNKNKEDELQKFLAWVNVFRTGEYIDKHTDASGHTQILIGLQGTNPKNGGTLYVEANEHKHPITMQAGDVLVFSAHRLPHYTTPLVPSEDCPHPRRITLSVRIFVH